MQSKARNAVRPPSEAEFDLILAGGEGQFVEFKESPSDSLAREIAAFANSGGGRLYLGVADDRSVKGVQVTNRMLSQVQDVARGCEPPVKVRLAAFPYRGRQLLMIDVPDGDRKPHSCSAGYFMRTGPNSQKMSRDELVEFARAVTQVEFDRTECPDFVYPRDLDVKALEEYVRRAEIPSRGLKREVFLSNLGVARLADGGVRINNAGVLFFAKDPFRLLPQSEVTCVLFRDLEGIDVIDRKDFRGNLLANIDDVEAFLKKHIAVRYEIKEFRRRNITELPEDALRESVVNAIMHRDYHVTGARVMVRMFPDRVEITNPGGLPPGLEPEGFGKISVHRNRLIADLLHRIDLGERIGSGIGRMRDAMRAAGLPAPKFDFDSFFVATFRKALKPSVQVVSDQVGTKSGLSRDQVTVLALCAEPKPLTRILTEFGRTNRTKFRTGVLNPLMRAGLLALAFPDKPRSRFQKYVITPAGRARLKSAK